MWLHFKSVRFGCHFDQISHTGSCPKLGWKKCCYNYLEETGRGEHLPLPATMLTKIIKALAEESTGHVLALSTLNLFQEPTVRKNHFGASLRGTYVLGKAHGELHRSKSCVLITIKRFDQRPLNCFTRTSSSAQAILHAYLLQCKSYFMELRWQMKAATILHEI